jgi:hypothetical protein
MVLQKEPLSQVTALPVVCQEMETQQEQAALTSTNARHLLMIVLQRVLEAFAPRAPTMPPFWLGINSPAAALLGSKAMELLREQAALTSLSAKYPQTIVLRPHQGAFALRAPTMPPFWLGINSPAAALLGSQEMG